MTVRLRITPRKFFASRALWISIIALALSVSGYVMAQQQQSGGGAGTAVIANAGTNLNTSALALETGGNLATIAGAVSASKMNVNLSSGNIGNTAFALNAGSQIIGFVRILPPGCGSLVTLFANSTAQVATGAGTTVTSTTTCLSEGPYANNITNSPVTLRFADKQGTPVIWLGGNADFTVPANSNIRVPLAGVTFTSGITAIAGTASAINLQVNGLQ